MLRSIKDPNFDTLPHKVLDVEGLLRHLSVFMYLSIRGAPTSRVAPTNLDQKSRFVVPEPMRQDTVNTVTVLLGVRDGTKEDNKIRLELV